MTGTGRGDRPALGTAAVAAALTGRGPATGGEGAVGLVRLATLGPAGTSAHEAARALAEAVRGHGDHEVDVELHARFDDARRAVHDGDATCALVPSAYGGATQFHWDPGLRLVGVLVHETPRYGLAVRADDDLGTGADRDLVVAALPEVSGLVDQLAPAALRGRHRHDRVAASTAAAARDVARGLADVAVCNEEGRRASGLRWLASRPGVPMPWSVFVRGPAAGPRT